MTEEDIKAVAAEIQQYVVDTSPRGGALLPTGTDGCRQPPRWVGEGQPQHRDHALGHRELVLHPLTERPVAQLMMDDVRKGASRGAPPHTYVTGSSDGPIPEWAAYITRRVLQAIPVIFLITVVSFLLMEQAPGGPAAQFSGIPRITAEEVDAWLERWCLERNPDIVGGHP